MKVCGSARTVAVASRATTFAAMAKERKIWNVLTMFNGEATERCENKSRQFAHKSASHVRLTSNQSDQPQIKIRKITFLNDLLRLAFFFFHTFRASLNSNKFYSFHS